MLGLALAAGSYVTMKPALPPVLPVTSVAPPRPDATESLTDEQLLALFPGTPVGIEPRWQTAKSA